MRAKFILEGWWGKGILDGDTPSDIKDILLQEFEEESPDFISALSVEQFMLGTLENWSGWWQRDDGISIGYQVLGVFLMDLNIKMGDGLKIRIIEEAEKDIWALRNLERKKVIKEFIYKIKKY
jgi:hypothetical protein